MHPQVRKFSRFVTVLLGMAAFGSTKAQLTTSNALTPAQLVQDVLLGPGIIASNITYTGYANAIGWFHNGNSGSPMLGIDSGVVMTNGTILANDPTYGSGFGPQGPNTSTGAGVNNGQPGDPYLDAVAGCNTFNACILEFDFVAQADSVKFNYVFGTDEYMEYVTGGFADVFAFVLSGVSVPLAPTNIALIPSTSTPVTALNVNANVNPAYYVSNENPAGTTVQYDGFTVVLTAQYPILCGETYHIKLACADALDGIVDGGVFLQAGSFTTGQVNVSTEISYGSLNDSTLYEGCGQACIILSRSGNLSNSDTAYITLGGTVTPADYSPVLPSMVIFLPGEDSVVFCVNAIQENIPEGLETLIFTSTTNGICVQNVSQMTLYISDFLPMNLDVGSDTFMCNPAPITISPNVTGGVQPYDYIWSTGDTTSSITVTPSLTTSYIVTVSDPCGSVPVTDTVTIFLPPVVTVTSVVSYGSSNDSTLYEGCGQACFILVRTSSLTPQDTAFITLSGTASPADYTPAIPNQIIFPSGQDTVIFCINAVQDNLVEGLESLFFTSTTPGQCAQSVSSASIYISNINPLTVNVGPDTTLCTPSSITFNSAITGGVQPYTILWSTGATTPSITVFPTVTTSYVITVTDPCGSVAAVDTVTIFNPSANPLSTSPTSDQLICSGDNVLMGVSATGGLAPYSFSWTTVAGSDFVPNPNVSMNNFIPSGNGTFVVQTTESCGTFRLDTIYISIHDCAVIPPNVFTPNGDGTNDNLVFFGLENFPGTSLMVYNRWGVKIYESSDYQNDWNGSGVVDGTYYYILKETDGTTLTGYLTIIK